jgi:RimJ/RimL family protein N-acetyltransferase
VRIHMTAAASTTGAKQPAGRVELRSMGDAEIAEVHRQQNARCQAELADFLDVEPPYLPMPLEKVRNTVSEYNRKERTYLVGAFDGGGRMVGLAFYGAEFDATWPWLSVLVFPEHRRKGHGRAIAAALLDRAFNQTHAHSACCHVPGWSDAGLAFAEAMGFRPAGRGRRSYVLGGRFVDGHFFDVLRCEYEGVDG